MALVRLVQASRFKTVGDTEELGSTPQTVVSSAASDTVGKCQQCVPLHCFRTFDSKPV